VQAVTAVLSKEARTRPTNGEELSIAIGGNGRGSESAMNKTLYTNDPGELREVDQQYPPEYDSTIWARWKKWSRMGGSGHVLARTPAQERGAAFEGGKPIVRVSFLRAKLS
jgi:hypothetical protein